MRRVKLLIMLTSYPTLTPRPSLFPYTTLFRSGDQVARAGLHEFVEVLVQLLDQVSDVDGLPVGEDRKSTRLNSSHGYISYAVFCLKKKNKKFFGPISMVLCIWTL